MLTILTRSIIPGMSPKLKEDMRIRKAKGIYAVDDNTLEFIFIDNIFVFDRIIPSKILFRATPFTVYANGCSNPLLPKTSRDTLKALHP